MLRVLWCSIFFESCKKQHRNLLFAFIFQYSIYFRGGPKTNAVTLISETWDQYLPLWRGNVTGETKIFLFGKRAEQNTHTCATSAIYKRDQNNFSQQSLQPAIHNGFLQMEFWDVSDEAPVPSMLQGRWNRYLHNELWGLSDIWWVPSDWTNLCVTEAFKIGDSKRSSSSEEIIFSSLCYNAAWKWNIAYTFFCTLQVQ